MIESETSNVNQVGGIVRKYWVPVILILLLLPSFYTAPHIIMKSENPNGEIEYPSILDVKSSGLVLIILDGVGENYILNDDYMPELNSFREDSATLQVRTGPLTLSATCVSELMTGVPNSPIDGLRNFNLNHPGGVDPWTLASKDDRYSVAMVGSYVMGNMYNKFDDINFVNTFQGHSDYYEGDEETTEIATNWISDMEHNVLAVHYSGPDKVGHNWGVTGPDYKKKLLDLDKQVSSLLDIIPENWTVIVTADHGMTEIGSHGSAEDVTRDVAAIVSGPGILKDSTDSVNQRDLASLVPLSLGLPFPIQLHGRIPLDILNYSPSESEVIERWNWEAAYYRQEFVFNQNNGEELEISLEEIEWNEIDIEGEFSRDLDIYISIAIWGIIAILSVVVLGLGIADVRENRTFFGIYLCTITAFLVSHASISYYPMIVRSIGGICAVWLVAWSLGRRNNFSSQNTFFAKFDFLNRIYSNPYYWLALGVILLMSLGSLTQAVVITLLLLSISYSVKSGFTNPEINNSKLPDYAPWLFAFLAFSFGSLRLWFALLPLFFITIGIIFCSGKKKISLEMMPIYSISVLSLIAITSIHTRILGTNFVFEFVKMGWPTNFENALFSTLLLVTATIVSSTALDNRIDYKKIILISSWLVSGLFASHLASSILDQIFLLLIVMMYFSSIYLRIKKPELESSTTFVFPAFCMQLLLTWGAWSTFITMMIIGCSAQLWSAISKDFKSKNISFSNPRMMIAMAVFPWVIWVLWWTLLGQVNGLQTCFEGICPHPRELDPGSVIVKGGYVGFREDPNLVWMMVMISSPIIIASSMIMYNLKLQDLNLYPYIISQAILILGCMSVLSFSPQYPRLMFSLFWNILFAIFQIFVAIFAILAFKFRIYLDNEYPKISS